MNRNRDFRLMLSALLGGGGILAAWSLLLIPQLFAQTEGPITAPATQTTPSAARSAPGSGAHPNVAGTWKLNRDQSDDPRKALPQAAGNGGNRGGGVRMGGPWGGGGMGGNRGGAGGGSGRPGGGAQGADAMDMEDYNVLTIAQTDSTAKITGATGRVLALYSNGAGNANETDTGYTPPAAQWKDNTLIVVEPTRGNTKITRTYQLAPDGKQLDLTTKIENPRARQPITLRFVYDPAPASSNSN